MNWNCTIVKPPLRARGRLEASLTRAVCLAAFTLGLPQAGDAQQTLIHAGRLLDVESGKVRKDVDILVSGDRIIEVGRNLKADAEARVIDLGDKTVLPGLIDGHTHICLSPGGAPLNPVLSTPHPLRALEGLAAAQAALMAGFTTLRDVDNEGADMADIAVRDVIDRGLFPGPRLSVSGWALSITGGHMNLTGLRPAVDRRVDQLAILVSGRDEMVAAIRDQAKAGVDFIKIYATGTLRHIDRANLEALAQFSLEEVRVMVAEAARWRMDVAAHAYGGDGAYNAVAGGVRSIEHGMFLDDRTLDLMKKKGTFWCPTMTVYLPEEGDDPEERAFHQSIVDAHRDTFRRAMKKGVNIVFGTDIGALPHADGWLELNRMAEYGMPPLDVIRSATVQSARLLRKGEELGKIAPHFLADIIAVSGEPERDIAALREVPFVMVGGKVAK